MDLCLLCVNMRLSCKEIQYVYIRTEKHFQVAQLLRKYVAWNASCIKSTAIFPGITGPNDVDVAVAFNLHNHNCNAF